MSYCNFSTGRLPETHLQSSAQHGPGSAVTRTSTYARRAASRQTSRSVVSADRTDNAKRSKSSNDGVSGHQHDIDSRPETGYAGSAAPSGFATSLHSRVYGGREGYAGKGNSTSSGGNETNVVITSSRGHSPDSRKYGFGSSSLHTRSNDTEGSTQLRRSNDSRRLSGTPYSQNFASTENEILTYGQERSKFPARNQVAGSAAQKAVREGRGTQKKFMRQQAIDTLDSLAGSTAAAEHHRQNTAHLRRGSLASESGVRAPHSVRFHSTDGLWEQSRFDDATKRVSPVTSRIVSSAAAAVSSEEFMERLLQAHHIADELLKARGLIPEDEMEYYFQWREKMAAREQHSSQEKNLDAEPSEGGSQTPDNKRRTSSTSDSGLSLGNDSENEFGYSIVHPNKATEMREEAGDNEILDNADSAEENVHLVVERKKKHKVVRLNVTVKRQNCSAEKASETAVVKLRRNDSSSKKKFRTNCKLAKKACAGATDSSLQARGSVEDKTVLGVAPEDKAKYPKADAGRKRRCGEVEMMHAFVSAAENKSEVVVICTEKVRALAAVSKSGVHASDQASEAPICQPSGSHATEKKEVPFALPRLPFYCRKFSGMYRGPEIGIDVQDAQDSENISGHAPKPGNEEQSATELRPDYLAFCCLERLLQKQLEEQQASKTIAGDKQIAKSASSFKLTVLNESACAPRREESFMETDVNKANVPDTSTEADKRDRAATAEKVSNDLTTPTKSSRVAAQSGSTLATTVKPRVVKTSIAGPCVNAPGAEQAKTTQMSTSKKSVIGGQTCVAMTVMAYNRQPESRIRVRLCEQKQCYTAVKLKYYEKTLKSTSGTPKKKVEKKENLDLLSARENLKRVEFKKMAIRAATAKDGGQVAKRAQPLGSKTSSTTRSKPEDHEKTVEAVEPKLPAESSLLEERERVERHLIAEHRRGMTIPKPEAKIPATSAIRRRPQTSANEAQHLKAGPPHTEARFIRRRIPSPLAEPASALTPPSRSAFPLRHVAHSRQPSSAHPASSNIPVPQAAKSAPGRLNGASAGQFGVTLKRVDCRAPRPVSMANDSTSEGSPKKSWVPKWRRSQRSEEEEEEEEEADEEVPAKALSDVKEEEDEDKLAINRAPTSRRPSQIVIEKDEKDMTEAEKAMLDAKKRHEEEDAAKLQEYEELRRIEREREEEELKQLKEKKERRKLEREEEERQFQERLRQEEERRKQEEDERKAKLEAEKRKKEEEKRKRQQMLSSQFATSQPGQTGRNFVIPQKSDKADKFGNIVQAKQEMGMTKEQQEEAKRNFLASAKRSVEIDYAGTSPAELRDKIRTLHQRICKLEADKYDLEKRHERQEYDLRELNERQRQVARNKALKKGLDPADTTSRHPPKVSIVSKYDRQIDRRNFKERRAMFETKNAYPCFPNVPPPPAIYEKVICTDEEKENEPDEEVEEEEPEEQVEAIAEEDEDEEE